MIAGGAATEASMDADRWMNEGGRFASEAMTMQRTRQQTEAPNGQPTATGAAERRIATLEARVEHLEATLEGFQDAVYRQSVLEDRRVAELSKRTAPHEMARALSEDARRHGV